MKVFFDTMIFLHYRSVDELEMADLLGSPTYTIVMPRITLRELDKHKNTHNSSRIRERARKLLKKVEQWSTGEEIRPGVAMELMASLPTVDYTGLGLNPDWSDDVLIASVLQYRDDHPEEPDVILVTQDSGPRITASQLGLRVLELPESLKLSADPDPLEVENRELLRTINALRNALPKLVVCFAGSGHPEQHASFSLPYPPNSIEQKITRKIDQLRAELPKQRPPTKTTASRAKLPTSIPLTGAAFTNHIDPTPAEEYKRYNQDVDEYLESYERYMNDTWEAQASSKRSIQFGIEIRNIGTAPAEDVDVLFHFPNGFQLLTEDDLPEIPTEPRLPIKPRTRMQMISERIERASRFDFSLPSLPDSMMHNSFSIKQTNSYVVQDHFSKIKHGDKAVLPKMILTFDSYGAAGSFSCDYTIRPANLPTPIKGQLHFVIEKQNANEATDYDEE